MSHPPLRVGMRLVGDEGYGPTVIEIRYVGEVIIARTISHNGKPPPWPVREHSWLLDYREWTEVTDGAGTPAAGAPDGAP